MSHPDTTEALLGIDIGARDSPLFLPHMITSGLPVRAIDALASFVAPQDVGFKYRLVPKATLERRRKSASKRLTTEEGDRLARLAKAFSFAIEIYKDPARARDFMTRPHAMLDGEQPIEVALATSAGTDIVVSLLGRMAYGGGV